MGAWAQSSREWRPALGCERQGQARTCQAPWRLQCVTGTHSVGRRAKLTSGFLHVLAGTHQASGTGYVVRWQQRELRVVRWAWGVGLTWPTGLGLEGSQGP